MVSDQIKWQQIVSIYKGESNQLYSCNTNRYLPNSMFPIYFYRTTLENIQSISMYILHFPSKSNLTKQVWYWDIKAACFIYSHSGRWVYSTSLSSNTCYSNVCYCQAIVLSPIIPVIVLYYEIWIYHVQLLNCEV